MEFPFTVVFEPPSHKELQSVLRMRGIWLSSAAVALTIGFILAFGILGRKDAAASAPFVPVVITSQPSAARALVDGRDAGSTPLHTSVAAGAHALVLKAPDALDGHYTLPADQTSSALHVVLWRRQPVINRLRSTLPGATLSDARLLADGFVALSLSLPTGQQAQAWRLDPVSGSVEPLLTDITGTRIVVSPDGGLIALLGSDVGPIARDQQVAKLVWVFGAHAPVPSFGVRLPLEPSEEVVDASWSPSADRLLIVATQRFGGRAARSRFWVLEPRGQDSRPVLTLPSEVNLGSELWSPDGRHIAFVAHASGLDALCLLDLDGGFRYVADLESPASASASYPPAIWSADSQRMLFVAPHQRPSSNAPSGWLQQPDPPRALYVADVNGATPTLVSDTTVDAAAWREDGQVVGMGRNASDGTLDARLMNGSATGERLVELPVRAPYAFSMAWDLTRAHLLIAAPTAIGAIEYYLVRLGLDDAA